MAMDTETVERVEVLSRLKMDDAKIEAAGKEFNKMLWWIEELNEVKRTNVEHLISVNDTTLRLRDDEITDGNYQEAVLKNAPDKEYDYFAVPKVVE